MPSYTSLLVLILAASTISPVLSADPPNVEGQAVEPSLKKRISFGTKFKLLLVAGLVGYNIWDWKKSTPKASKTQPTSETPPTTTAPATSGTPPTTTAPSGTPSTPTTPVPSSSGTSPPAASQQLIYEGSTTDPTLLTKPAQDIARREERSPGHHPHADIPAGNLEARSFVYNIRRASSQLDLSNRDDLEENLSLFSRMLDKLD